MKKMIMLAALLSAIIILTGCSPKTEYPTATPAGAAATQASLLAAVAVTDNSNVLALLPEGYDPAAEEKSEGEYSGGAYDEQGRALYAGSTPIPLDPIDMPTPTPRPDLVFTYAAYTAAKLGLTFESVIGYEIDDTREGTYILTEPAAQKKDNVSVVITLTVASVTTNYKESDMKTDLIAYLANMGSVNYTKWESTTTAERTLLDKPGCYANYRGVLYSEDIVRGRVHMALIGDNKLLTLHVACPGWYNTSYMKVYTQIRNTLKAI